jgi:hypothetical protein
MKRRPVIQRARKTKPVYQKIVSIGNIHARNRAPELEHCLGSTFTVSSFVKPGARMRAIVDAMKEDIMELKSDDVVIWGGSNDIGKNNSREALKHLCNFVKNNQMLNTVVMTAPPRCDLLPSSFINDEVNSFNRHLNKRMGKDCCNGAPIWRRAKHISAPELYRCRC